MASDARRGKGSKFYIGNDDSTSLVSGDNIAQVRGIIPLPSEEVEDIDVTNHDSPRNQKEYIPGDGDLGDLEIEAVYTEDQYSDLQTKKGLGKLKMRICIPQEDGTFTGSLPNTTPRADFIGYIKSLSADLDQDGAVMTKFTIKVCSDYAYTAT
jgi:hypothetical protein